MVTVPTIDQISGTTVMNKLRDLIRKFIQFATEVDEELTVNIPDYVQTYVSSVLEDYYTKTQIDTALALYYTKTETDNLLSAKQGVLTVSNPLSLVSDALTCKYDGSTIDLDSDGNLKAIIPTYVGGIASEVDSNNVINILVDNDTIKINSDNELYADIPAGATYTGVAPISISANNEISLEGWVEITTDKAKYINDNISTKDMKIVWNNFEFEIDRNLSLTNMCLIAKNGYATDAGFLGAFVILKGSIIQSGNNYYLSFTGIRIKSETQGSTNTATISASQIKAYDLDGTQITSSNIGDYIDSSNNVIKPLIVKPPAPSLSYSGYGMLFPGDYSCIINRAQARSNGVLYITSNEVLIIPASGVKSNINGSPIYVEHYSVAQTTNSSVDDSAITLYARTRV